MTGPSYESWFKNWGPPQCKVLRASLLKYKNQLVMTSPSSTMSDLLWLQSIKLIACTHNPQEGKRTELSGFLYTSWLKVSKPEKTNIEPNLNIHCQEFIGLWSPTLHSLHVIGASLSEPHTSMTVLQDACVCLSVCLHVAIYRKLNWTNGNEGMHTFQIYTRAKAVWWIATEDSSPCNSMPMNVLSVRDRLLLEARLQHRRQREQEGRRSKRTEVRQTRLDVHGEESVAFSGSIGVELNSERSIVSACAEHYKFRRCYITHQ